MLAFASLVSCPSTAAAVDGSVDVRQSDQHARSEEQSFRTYWRREALAVRQLLRFGRHVHLDADFRGTRETAGGDAPQAVESRQTTRAPDVSLSYRSPEMTIGARFGTLSRTSSSGGVETESLRKQVNGWLSADLSTRTRLSSSVTRTESDATDARGTRRESSQTSGTGLLEQSFARTWLAQYRFSGRTGDIATGGSHREHTTHGLELRGSPRLIDGRVATSFRLRSQVFDQKRELSSGEEAERYRSPLSAGYTFDDTPETLDPLEGSVLPAPELFDGDRTATTTINLGDDAPVVREFGGDYRNIQFDFGETQLLASASLYVDTRLLQPGLMQWRVFVSDDPEGRLWQEVSADRFSMSYEEWGDVLQGWEARFSDGVSGRYVKFVNGKLGAVSAPELLVTELEVFTRETATRARTDERTFDHNADASVSYDVTSRVRVGYQTALRRRDEVDGNDDLTGAAHAFTTRWTGDVYAAGGRYDVHTLDGPSRSPTDVATVHLFASRGEKTEFVHTASWTRSDDRSAGARLTTNSFSFATRWQAAPRLWLRQRFTHGRRSDDVLGVLSRSVTVTHTVRSSPLATLTVNLDRRDRWASRSAGSGFERFHDTEVDVIWAPMPLVSMSTDLLIRERSDTDWSTRQSVSWSPLPGGRVETHISGNSFYDSRTEVRRLGVDFAVTWKPRRALVVEGSVGLQRYEVGGERDTPVNTYLRAGWTF